MSIEDFMKKEFVTIQKSTLIGEAKRILRTSASNCCVVSSDKNFEGIVKADEILGMDDALPVTDYIHDVPYTLSPQDTLDEAAVFFLESDMEILPVISSDKLVGVISIFDILDAFTQMAGFGEGGIRIEVDLKDTPGSLKHVLDVLYLHSMNVLSVLIYPTEQVGNKIAVIRVEGKSVKELSRILDINEIRYTSIIKEEKL
ncbi:CBS domain-containing protein [Athalassotoga sp.]|uniref:CBS domain-containing protein n=1 Tax=Athalassotoga sp. TaxID=2022597 RepID=UPI003D05AEF4